MFFCFPILLIILRPLRFILQPLGGSWHQGWKQTIGNYTQYYRKLSRETSDTSYIFKAELFCCQTYLNCFINFDVGYCSQSIGRQRSCVSESWAKKNVIKTSIHLIELLDFPTRHMNNSHSKQRLCFGAPSLFGACAQYAHAAIHPSLCI